MPLSARLRIRNASTSKAEVYEGATLSTRTLAAIERAGDDGLELPALSCSIVTGQLLGAAQKATFPGGRHRATVEVSRDGATWSPVVNGTIVAEDLDHGPTFAAKTVDQHSPRVWGLTIRQDALDDAWSALGAVPLVDLAVAAIAASEHVDVDWIRATGTGTESLTARVWSLRALVARGVTAAGLTLDGQLPNAFPYERQVDDDGFVYLAQALPLIAIGRPQLTGAPSVLHGDHPTMPAWTVADLLAAWQGQQQLTISATYAAYPDASVVLAIRDPWALRDPSVDGALVLPQIDAHVVNRGTNAWTWRTEGHVVDGVAVQDVGFHYEGGVDASGIGRDYPVPARATYAASRVLLTGAAPDRQVANRHTNEWPWRLAPITTPTSYEDPFDGHLTDVHVGVPVFDVSESYLAAPEQDGDASIVRIVALERANGPYAGGGANGAVRVVERREPQQPLEGEPAASGGLWATELYRRHALAVGDVDTVVCVLPEEEIDLSEIEIGDPQQGVSFAGLDWVVLGTEHLRRTNQVRLTLGRPSAGWAAASAPDVGSAGSGPSRPAPYMSLFRLRDEAGTPTPEGDPQRIWRCEFRATVDGASVPHDHIEFEFSPASGAGGLASFEVSPRGAFSAEAVAEEVAVEGVYSSHPYTGQQARARAVYPGGYTTAWTAWATATTL